MIFGKYINKYYLRFFHYIFAGLIALIAVDIAQLKIPEYYKLIVNGINDGFVEAGGTVVAFDAAFVVNNIGMPMVAIIAVIVASRFLWRVSLLSASAKTETALRKEMFDKCMTLSAAEYADNKVGSLMSLFTNDLETIDECFGWGILRFFDAVFLGGLAVYKMANMSLKLTLLCMVPMALMIALSALVGKFMAKKWELRQEVYASLSDFAQETFSGISVIKAFVKEAAQLSRFAKLNVKNEKVNVEFTKMSRLLNSIIVLLVGSVEAIILGYGGYLVYSDVFNAGELLEFLGYFGTVVWPVMAVAELIDTGSRGKASLKRITKLLDTDPSVKDAPDAADYEVKGEIELRHLSFTYPLGDRPSLKDVSVNIKAGQNVGILGSTGCGKTTIAELLLRFYDAPDGSIKIDGRDIKDFTLRSLRRSIAYAPQDNFLFNDTIANNIAFGNEHDDDVSKFASMADVDGDITAFKDGYNTVLGERGVTVSGGQKQRISMARAFYKQAPILILDDSVSAVDTATERNILDSIKKERAGKTTLLMSHRISSVRDMDVIVYMDDGLVIGSGSHDKLYDTCEKYRLVADMQKLDEEGGNE